MNTNMTFSVEELEDDTQNTDISKVIRQKFRDRRHAMRLYDNQFCTQSSQFIPSTQNEPLQTDNCETDQKMVTFRNETKQTQQTQQTTERQVKPFRSKRNDQTLISSGKVCKICYDVETEQYPLLRACQCIRTKKYVHEECLKSAIIDEYHSRLKDAKCSICGMHYNMDIESQTLFLPAKGWEQSQDKIPLIVLIVFQLVLIVIVILLSVRLQQNQNDIQNQNRNNLLTSKVFIIIFIIFLVLVMILITWFIIMIIKNILYVKRISRFKILEYVPEKLPQIHEQNIEFTKEGILKLQKIIKSPEIEPINYNRRNTLNQSEHVQTRNNKYFKSMAKMRQSVAF